MEISIENLLKKARKGNERALNDLIQKIYPKIYNFSFRYVGSHDEAMEVSQKSLIKIYKNIQKLKDIKSWESWMYRITINICHEENRKAKTHKVISIHDRQEIWESKQDFDNKPDRNLEQQETKEILQEALQSLPEEQRLVLIMKEYQGLKFREIAETLEISENTAKSRLYYAMKALKKNLETQNFNPKTLNYAT